MAQRSKSWGCRENNNRGDEVEDWRTETNMILLNDRDDPPMFYSRRWMTTSTPDIAFSTGDIAGKINRQVLDQLGGSDHRPVLLKLQLNDKHKNIKSFPRWNYRKADWEKIHTTYR